MYKLNKKALLAVALATPLLISSVSFSTTAQAAENAPVTTKKVTTVKKDRVKLTKEEKRKIKSERVIAKKALPKDPRGPMPNSPAEWDQWVKDHPEPVETDSLITAPTTARLATVTTTDKILPLHLFDNGDLIFGAGVTGSAGSTTPYGYFRHGSMYDERSNTFVSADPSKGVYKEPISMWQQYYKDVSINYVPKATATQLASVMENAWYHRGEPYSWYSSKTETTKWYCTKLAWFEYNKWAKLDLDSNGGYWATPDDLYYSNYVLQFWRG